MKFIKKMEELHCIMFGSNPKLTFMSPLDKGDHPELDASKYLDQTVIQKRQSLVGATQ